MHSHVLHVFINDRYTSCVLAVATVLTARTHARSRAHTHMHTHRGGGETAHTYWKGGRKKRTHTHTHTGKQGSCEIPCQIGNGNIDLRDDDGGEDDDDEDDDEDDDDDG